MGHEVDILPHLLLPLAGPEEFDEEVRRLFAVHARFPPGSF